MVKTFVEKYNNRVNCINEIEIHFKQKDKDIIKKFLVFCRGTAGKTTLKKLHRMMIKICDVLEGDLDKIDLDRLREFLAVVNDSNLMPPTKNELRKVMKRFLREYYDDWSSRFKGLKDIKGEKEINQDKINANTILRQEEIEALMRGCSRLKYKALILMMFEVAGRPEEILKLRWKDINLNEGDVKLKSSKTGNLRVNPIQNSIIHIKRYKQEYPFTNMSTDDYVFPSPYNRNKHQSLPALGLYIKRLGRKILRRDIFPYLFRHTRATELQKVLPAKVYEKFMDHSIETATRYSHLNKHDVRDAMFDKVYQVKELSEEKKSVLEKQVKELQERFATLAAEVSGQKSEELTPMIKFLSLPLETQEAINKSLSTVTGDMSMKAKAFEELVYQY